MFSTIKPRTRSQKAARTRARNKYAPERAALRPEFEPEIPADGIDRFKDLITGHDREICLTPEAMEARRLELWARCGGQCEGCRFPIRYEGIGAFHLHHIHGKGRGRCDCMKCIQALCYDTPMQDNTDRPGCHRKVHQGRLGEMYKRPERTSSTE